MESNLRWAGQLNPEVMRLVIDGLDPPRGIRNCNPGNIRVNYTFLWQHQVGVDIDGYAIFDQAVYGIRAMSIILDNYISHYGLDTISGMIHRWSGDDEEIKQSYVAFVAGHAGVSPWSPLDYRLYAVPVLSAMIAFENAVTYKGTRVNQWYTEATIKTALGLSHTR